MAEVNKKKIASRKARDAQKEMMLYMKEHNLDPKKDWTKDKEHGKKIQAWIDIINLGNKKSKELHDEEARERVIEKKLKKPDVHPRVKKVESVPNVYDYPTLDGKEMSQAMKKKYRQKMRGLLKTMGKEKAEEAALKFIKTVKEPKLDENKNPKKVEKAEKAPIKKSKKDKKVEAKEEPKTKGKPKKDKKKKKVEED